jgi:hypothetical protein
VVSSISLRLNLIKGTIKDIGRLVASKLPSGLNKPLGLRLVRELRSLLRLGFSLFPWAIPLTSFGESFDR